MIYVLQYRRYFKWYMIEKNMSLSLTSKIPLTEVKQTIESGLRQEGKDYVVSYVKSGGVERVQVWPIATGFFGRLFGKPVAEVSREISGLRRDMPDYRTSDEWVISSTRLKEIVYGKNGTTP